MATKYNFEIDKGSTFQYDIVYKLKDPNTEVATVVDLTDYTARMQIRTTIAAATTILELTTENGGITITPADGKISLFIADSATSSITIESGVYDLEIVSPGPQFIVRRLLEGKIKFRPEVTR